MKNTKDGPLSHYKAYERVDRLGSAITREMAKGEEPPALRASAHICYILARHGDVSNDHKTILLRSAVNAYEELLEQDPEGGPSWLTDYWDDEATVRRNIENEHREALRLLKRR